MIRAFAQAVEELTQEPLTVYQITDILWLAVQMSQPPMKQESQVKTTPRNRHSSSPGNNDNTDKSNSDETSPDSGTIAKKDNSAESASGKTPPDSDITPTEKEDESPQLPVYPSRPAGHSPVDFRGFKTDLLAIAEAPALPGKLALSRALRPLKQQVASRVRQEIDEEATAERIAEQQRLPTIIHRSARERWLDVALVIDQSPSMRLWHRVIQEFQIFLEQHGAFRSIRIWKLVYDQNQKRTILAVGPHTSRQSLYDRNPQELVDPTRRRLILVVSDCIGPAWYDGTILKMIEDWGKVNHVSIVQMLSERLWSRSVLRNGYPTQLHLPYPAAPNRQMRDVEGLAQGLCVPVITLETASLKGWATACAEGSIYQAKGTIFAPGSTNGEDEPASPSLDARGRVERFWQASSEPVRRLAGLLSYLPVTLPVIRLVQHTMFPARQRRTMDIAEILMGGLVYEVNTNTPPQVPDDLRFEFIEGIRDILATTRPMPEHIQVVHLLSDYIAANTGTTSVFPALLAAATTGNTSSFIVPEESRPFARLTARLLRKMGGNYAAIAEQLEEGIDHTPLPDSFPVVEETPDGKTKQEQREQTIADLEASLQLSLPDSIRQMIAGELKGLRENILVGDYYQNFHEFLRNPIIFKYEYIDFYKGIGREIHNKIVDIYKPFQEPSHDFYKGIGREIHNKIVDIYKPFQEPSHTVVFEPRMVSVVLDSERLKLL
jgi:hypothetical protein